MMWRIVRVLALPLFLFFIWASNIDYATPPDCIEWEWTTATMDRQDLGGGHIGTKPIKVKRCVLRESQE